MKKKKKEVEWYGCSLLNARFIHQFFHFVCSTMRMVSLVMDFPFHIHRKQLLSWQRDIHIKVDEFFFIVIEVNFWCRFQHIQFRSFKFQNYHHWRHVNGHDSWWIQQKNDIFFANGIPFSEFLVNVLYARAWAFLFHLSYFLHCITDAFIHNMLKSIFAGHCIRSY